MSCNEKLVIQSLYNLIVVMNKNAFNKVLPRTDSTDISPETEYQANLQLTINEHNRTNSAHLLCQHESR